MRSGRRGVSRNVFLLGLVSLLGDVSSEMVVPLLPAFLVALGGGAEALGAIEGAAEATASFFKYLSGRWADRVRRLLPMAVAGYALAAAVRPLLALARSPWHVFAVRCVDRVGKGIRTSPRDKLLAASAEPERLAEAYSFHRGMDHLGAAVGPLIATALLLLWPGQLRLVFALAAIPGALAVALLFAVRETPTATTTATATATTTTTTTTTTASTPTDTPARRLPAGLLASIFLFTLGNSTDALLLLRAQGLGVPTALLPALWTELHVVRAATSWPLGRLADRLGRRASLAAGWGLYAVCYLGFAVAADAWQAWALFAAYGLVAGLSEGTERALVASSVSQDRRGHALGLYNLVSGFGLLAASVLAGELWDHVSPGAALGLGAALAAAAAVLLLARRGAPQLA
ncbi:MAG TPA: MFS transporter [Myxococcales bacterium]